MDSSTELNKAIVQSEALHEELKVFGKLDGLSSWDQRRLGHMRSRANHIKTLARRLLKGLDLPEWTSERKDQYRKETRNRA